MAHDVFGSVPTAWIVAELPDEPTARAQAVDVLASASSASR